MQRLGIDPVVEGPGHARPVARASLVIWVESAPVRFPVELLATEPPPSAAWVIDTHRIGAWRRHVADLVGGVAYAQRAAAAGDGSGRGRWLPLAAPIDLAHPQLGLDDRPYDIAFAGQAPPGSKRARILDGMEQRFSVLRLSGVRPSEMMEAYGQARVIFNLPLAGELNMRVFEAAASRSLLLCGPTADLDLALPTGGHHEVVGHEPEVWASSLRRLLDSDTAQAEADAAHDHVSRHHTYDDRARELLAMAEVVTTSPRRRRLTVARSYVELGRADAVEELDLPGPVRIVGVLAARASTRLRRLVKRLPRRGRRLGPRF